MAAAKATTRTATGGTVSPNAPAEGATGGTVGRTAAAEAAGARAMRA